MTTVLQIISDTNIGGGGRSLLNYLRYQNREDFRSCVVLPRNSALKDPLQQLGVDLYEIDAMADKSMDFKAIQPLRRIIRVVKPDLIHTHGAMAGRIAARLCGCKVLYTKHCAFPPGKLLSSPPGRLVGWTMDACLSDGVIAVGDSAREILMQGGIPERKIHVMFNGVAPLNKPTREQREELRAQYGFEPDDFVVGILARVEEYKGHSTLFDAAEKLMAGGRKVKLLVAGEGSQEQNLRLRALSFPQGSVFFTGFVQDVEKALWAMDVQVNASTQSETSSLSLLEGMSIGLPAVVSNVGGNPLLIRDGENGLVFPKRNAHALARCIARLMDDPEELSRMSRRSDEIFREEYTGEIFAKHMEDVYSDVLKGARHGREKG